METTAWCGAWSPVRCWDLGGVGCRSSVRRGMGVNAGLLRSIKS